MRTDSALRKMVLAWKVWLVAALGLLALGLAAALALRAAGGGSPPGGNLPGEGQRPAGEVPLLAARLDLAARLQLPVAEVRLSSVRPAGFDGCLGVYRPGEPCTEQFLAGYIAAFAAGGREYRYHFGGGRFVAASFASGARVDDGSVVPPNQAPDLAALLAAYAREDLALRLAPAGAVTVTAIVPTTFPDGCLALAAPGEGCEAALSPGAVFVLETNGQEYRYHAGGSGAWQLRYAGQSSPVQLPGETLDLQLALRKDLAQRLSLPLAEVSLGAYRAVTWPDGCLGVYDPGTVCSQALVEGWSGKLLAGGKEYVYHGAAGGRFIAASFRPGAEIREP